MGQDAHPHCICSNRAVSSYSGREIDLPSGDYYPALWRTRGDRVSVDDHFSLFASKILKNAPCTFSDKDNEIWMNT